MTAQFQQSNLRFAEANRTRQSAVQEAAFYRAKAEALEFGSPSDVAKMERERSADLERQLTSISTDYSALQRQVASLQESYAHEKKMGSTAEEREREAVGRLTDLETTHARTAEDLLSLQEKTATTERSLRDHVDRVLSLESLVVQHRTDKDLAQSSLEQTKTTRDAHLKALEQLQLALEVSKTRSDETQGLYQAEQERSQALEHDVVQLQAELEVRGRETEAATARLTDVEASWRKTQEEVDTLRTFGHHGLTELLNLHRELKADEDRSTRGHDEKVAALEQQASSLRTMLGEAGTRVDESQLMLAEHRRKTQRLELDHTSLRTGLHQTKTSLSAAQAEIVRLKDQLTTKEFELKDQSSSMSELELRLATLRNLLADHGVAVNEDEVHSEDGFTSGRTRQLESKLSEKAHALEEAERELDLSRKRLEGAEARMAEMSTAMDRSNVSGGGSESPSVDQLRLLESRAESAEKQLVESTASHKQVQADYQTAVHYVK